MKRLDSCSTCFEPEEQLKDNILGDRPQWSSRNRNIFFAPCGNHHLFGLFNNGKTPKVVIMGITTSPDAKDNFQYVFKQCIDNDLSVDDALRLSSIANCFNSKRPTLQRNLSKIVELSGVFGVIGVKTPVETTNDLFFNYVNRKCTDDEKKVVESVYFSQAILCSSCKSDGRATAPRQEDIEDYHIKCLKAQAEIIESFDAKIDLWISFGINDYGTLSSEGCFKSAGLQRRILAKCKNYNYVRITHPSGMAKGWNKLSTFDQILRENPEVEKGEFMVKVKDNLDGKTFKPVKSGFLAGITFDRPSEAYRKQILDCAEQLMRLRKIVKSLVS